MGNMKIDKPILIVFKNEDENIQTHLFPKDRPYTHYGILIADIVRHVAKAYKVDENDVWEWVDKERYKPTSPVTEIKPN